MARNGLLDDLTGQRFGKLIVLRELGAGKIEVRCDCGIVKSTTKQYVKNGQSKSCGCGRYDQRPGTLRTDVGDRFGRLVIVKFLGSNGRKRELLVLCDCGAHKVVVDADLRAGTTLSCGCYRKERIGDALRTHGESGKLRTYLYRTWEGMCHRVKDPKRHATYVDRGIKVCTEWEESFVAFRDYVQEHLGERPEGYSLDRIDNNKNYEPGNVRWATAKRQVRNRSSNVLVTIEERTMCVSEWADEVGLRAATLRQRILRVGGAAYAHLAIRQALAEKANRSGKT